MHPGFARGDIVGSRPPGPIVVSADRVAVLRAWGGAPELLRREATTRRKCGTAQVEAQQEVGWLHLRALRPDAPRAPGALGGYIEPGALGGYIEPGALGGYIEYCILHQQSEPPRPHNHVRSFRTARGNAS